MRRSPDVVPGPPDVMPRSPDVVPASRNAMPRSRNSRPRSSGRASSSTRRVQISDVAARAPLYLATYVLSIATLFPLYYTLDTALKTEGQYARSTFGLVSRPTFENFINAWSTSGLGLDVDMLHSAIVAVGGTIICVAAAALAGFGLSQMKPKPRRRLLIFIVAFMMITPPVLIVPLYLSLIRFNLADNFVGGILAYAALFVPFSVYLTSSFFGEVPREILESAVVDGAGPWQRFQRIVLPIGRPALTTLSVLIFLWIWNDLLFALILLQGSNVRTAMASIAGLIGQYNLPETGLAAGLLVAMVPPLVVFFLFQSKIERGLTMGTGK
jgi:ABC-type glycerol-3-phosphate transport system permease component